MYLATSSATSVLTPQRERLGPPKNSLTQRNKKEVQRYLGLCIYYRRFVKNFSKLPKPLHHLTKDLTEFQSNDVTEPIVELLENKLPFTPALAHLIRQAVLTLHRCFRHSSRSISGSKRRRMTVTSYCLSFSYIVPSRVTLNNHRVGVPCGSVVRTKASRVSPRLKVHLNYRSLTPTGALRLYRQ